MCNKLIVNVVFLVLTKLKDSLETRVVNLQMKADVASKLEKENKKLTEREEES